MNLRLNSKHKSILIEVKEHFGWEGEFKFDEQPTCIILKDLDENEAIDLRELCSDYLLEVGFDEEYVVNEKGKLLEALVDKLYVK